MCVVLGSCFVLFVFYFTPDPDQIFFWGCVREREGKTEREREG